MKCFTVRKKPNYAPIIVLLSVFCAFTVAWVMEKVDAIHNPVYLAIGIGVCVACLCIYTYYLFHSEDSITVMGETIKLHKGRIWESHQMSQVSRVTLYETCLSIEFKDGGKQMLFDKKWVNVDILLKRFKEYGIKIENK